MNQPRERSSEIVWRDDVPDDARWLFDDARFDVDDVEYVSTLAHRSAHERLCIKKPPALVHETAALLEQFRDPNVVELGISQGGSTAFVAQMCHPRKLVALELEPEPVAPLQAFIDDHDLGDVVRPHYGIDQADTPTITTILEREFGDERLDLVIDDASHLLAETRASFDLLFPRLRPGGLFVIEDWNWQHLRVKGRQHALEAGDPSHRAEFDRRLKEALSDPTSREHATLARWMEDNGAVEDAATAPTVGGAGLLTVFVVQLLLACAWSSDVVSRVDVHGVWAVVHRGPAELDPHTFRIDDATHDTFGLLPRMVSL